jgi:hypothetical protein
MEDLVQKIIQYSKSKVRQLNPRQVFFREFDAALQLASRGMSHEEFTLRLMRLEQCGQEAGLSAGEMAQRKQTLLWTSAQAA